MNYLFGKEELHSLYVELCLTVCSFFRSASYICTCINIFIYICIGMYLYYI